MNTFTEDLIKQLGRDSNEYVAEEITLFDNIYEQIKSTISTLQRSLDQIEVKRKRELDRYVELRNKISLIGFNMLSPNNEEIELYKLHQIMLKRYTNHNPIVSDEELCERMQKMNVRLYETAKLIPLGSDYDNCQEYLRAYNRLKKKRQAERKKTNLPSNVNNTTFYAT